MVGSSTERLQLILLTVAQAQGNILFYLWADDSTVAVYVGLVKSHDYEKAVEKN